MSKPKIIGLTGYARSGKDTVGEILTSQHGFTRLAFADGVRNLAARIDPILDNNGRRLSSYIEQEGWEDSKVHPEVRQFLQTLGVAVRDTLGASLWIDALFRKAVRLGTPVVITDVRFVNEADAIRDRGGVVWRVERPGTGPVNGHVSETAMDGYIPDYTIYNVASLDYLADSVRAAL